MSESSSWKYYVMLVIALMGVAIPLWQGRSGTEVRSLTIDLLSQTSLRPDLPTPLSGVLLTVDGQRIEHPYLSVLKLVNDGSRALLASDYEAPLELRVNKGVRLVRGQVTSTLPNNLEPRITTDSLDLKVEPLLLNPGDSITVAVVTSGLAPRFTARARIAGISEVEVRASMPEEKEPRKYIFGALTGVILVLSYPLLFMADFNRPLRSRIISIVMSLACAMGGVILINQFGDHFNLSTWQVASIIFACVFAGMFAEHMSVRAPHRQL